MGAVNFPVDGRELYYNPVTYSRRPYVSKEEVFANIPAQFRYVGLRVIIGTSSNNDQYYFKNGINNSDLVIIGTGPAGPPGPAGAAPVFSNDYFNI